MKYYKGRIDRMDDKEANFMVSSLSGKIRKIEKILIDHVQNSPPPFFLFPHSSDMKL